MLERTLIFVDTSYLLASFYNSWETGARSQLEIDLPDVVRVLERMAVNELDQPVHRQNWYDGIPDSGPHRYQRALRSEPGVRLRAGQLIEWGDRRTQKAVDTRLVADMVRASLSGTVSDIILVSGDADMIPGVEEAADAGVRVHLYGFGWDSMSSNLRFACDSTTILDPREDFRDCMRLRILEGPLPTAVSSNHENCESQHDSPNHISDSEEYDALAADDAPEALAKHKPLGDAEPVEDLSGTSTVPDPRDTPQDEHHAAPHTSIQTQEIPSLHEEHAAQAAPMTPDVEPEPEDDDPTRPNPSMMAPRRKIRSRYVPLPTEVWQLSGDQNPFDVGEQYAVWWYDHAATPDQRKDAHTLTGGGLPPTIDRPLLQFACQTLHEFTLTESQRVQLRDGFHSGVRGILINTQKP